MIYQILMFLSMFSTPQEQAVANDAYRTLPACYAGENASHWYFPATRSEASFRTGKLNYNYALAAYYFNPTLYSLRVYAGYIDGKFHLFVADTSTPWDGVPKEIHR